MGGPAKPTPEKSCKRCGKLFTRWRRGTNLEQRASYMKRRYCSMRCANMRGRWGTSKTALHREAQKSVLDACQECGRTGVTLHVHHVNGDPTDNRSSNYRTVCCSCHKLLHGMMASCPS